MRRFLLALGLVFSTMSLIALEAVVVGKVRALHYARLIAMDADHLAPAEMSAESTLHFASFEIPLTFPLRRPPSRDAAADQVIAMLPPAARFDDRAPPALEPDAVEKLAVMIPAPAPLDRRPPANLDSAFPPLLEPFMEVFEDWVVKSPVKRHPGFERVHFATNVQGRCLPSTLLNVLYDAAVRFGDIRVISGYRSPSHNRAVGGATRSLHMECRAIDFFVAGTGLGVVDWLVGRRDVGGYKRYPFGSFHIDNGPRRTWSWPSRRSRRR